MTHSDTAEAGKGMVLRHASLFSGIGGFELAAQWMGWENVLSCEFSDFPQSILRHHFPTTHHYGDIRQLDGTKYRGTIDVLTGGFPCQPFSSAGKRRGTEDNRFLWPEMLRVIREIQPTWIVAENVRGITSIDNGMVFERVCSELEANGYEVQAFCIPACAVGAPHKRERIWFVAHATGKRGGTRSGDIQEENGRSPEQLSEFTCTDSGLRTLGHAKHDGQPAAQNGEGSIERGNGDATRQNEVCEPAGSALPRAIANSPNIKCQRRECCGSSSGESEAETGNGDCYASDNDGRKQLPANEGSTVGGQRSRENDRGSCWAEHWLEAATRLCRVDDGLPRELDGITIPKWRRESLKAYGNAIVPQVAYEIFQAIQFSL